MASESVALTQDVDMDVDEETSSNNSDGEKEALETDDDATEDGSSGKEDADKTDDDDEDGNDSKASKDEDETSIEQEESGEPEAAATEVDDDTDDNLAPVLTQNALSGPPKSLSLATKGPSLSTSGIQSTGSSGSNKVKLIPKVRIKLSLKLPTQANKKKKLGLPTMQPKATASAPPQHSDDDDDGINAMVVDSNETVDVVAVPTSPPHTTGPDSKKDKPKFFKKSLPKAATGTASKRKSFQPSKRIKLPPITSPGLLMLRPPPGSGHGQKQATAAAAIAAAAANSPGPYLTSQDIFASAMATAGYSAELRATRPHRGSSVAKTVGDLFDTNVKLALHKIDLVPQDLWTAKTKVEGVSLPQLLGQRLQDAKRKREANNDGNYRRFAPCRFHDMAPVSLTIPYPPEYIQKRLQYVEDVKSRENAIVQWQAAQEQVEIAREEQEERELQLSDEKETRSSRFINPVTIPPIPEPPEPPRVQDLTIPEQEDNGPASSGSTSISPYYYLEKETDTKRDGELIAHLDNVCFDMGEGRYFGLLTNRIADPNYIGANAPGIAVVSATGSGGGLATATTSTTTSTSGLSGGGMTMILSASFHSAAAVPPNKDGTTSSREKADAGGDGKNSKTSSKAATSPSSASILPGTAAAAKSESASPATTTSSGGLLASVSSASQSKLRKIMESGNDTIEASAKEALIDCINREIVYAIRTEKQGGDDSFRGPDGHLYPELGRAFAALGIIKPCERCKSNKQGVFHCRVRRRHKEADFDGGTSIDTLQPWFKMPLESLLHTTPPVKVDDDDQNAAFTDTSKPLDEKVDEAQASGTNIEEIDPIEPKKAK